MLLEDRKSLLVGRDRLVEPPHIGQHVPAVLPRRPRGASLRPFSRKKLSGVLVRGHDPPRALTPAQTRDTHVYTFGVQSITEVLSVREFRAGLTGIIDEINSDHGAPVFVGAHRKPEAVLMSVSQYQALQDATERQRAVAEALASVRAEGLEPSPQDLLLLADLASGARPVGEVQAEFLARYRR